MTRPTNVGIVAWMCAMATLAGAQRTFQQRAAGVQQKFDLGTGKARFPGGYVPPVRRDGFRVDRVYYAPRISTPKGNATQAPQFAVQTLPERGVAGKLRGFVTTSGTQLMLNGMPWYCAGTNAYYAALKWLMSDSEVSVMMREHSARGATVLRVFAHSFFQGLGNSNSVPQPMMPIIGEYNEEAIRRLDLALAAASQNGIRLILVLGNYWPFLGGIQDWVDQKLGSGRDMPRFFSDPTLRESYKDWIKHIVTRTSTVTGRRYVDDPTILAWELLNEPRAAVSYAGGGDYERSRGLPPGKIICDWVAEMSSFIKSLDRNHLVTTGEEGFRTEGSTQEPHSWISNGYVGVDFACNVGVKSIDFATLHAYPDQWGMNPPNGYTWLGENYFKDRAQLVHSLNKPIILEEYGGANNYFGPREGILSWQQDRVNELDYACTLVWAVSHYSTDNSWSKGQLFGKDAQGYVFGYDSDGAQAVLRQYAYMKAKTAGKALPAPTPAVCTDVAPSKDFTCQQQASWGKCDQSWMQGFCAQSCNRCPGGAGACTDIAPTGTAYTCPQQAAFGKCNEAWMQGQCKRSCGRC